MKMKKLLLFAVLFVVSISALAQQKLEDIVKPFRERSAYELKLSIALNTTDSESQWQNISLKIDGDKYAYSLGRDVVFSDGQRVYTYAKEFNELTIEPYSKSPKAIIAIDQKDFTLKDSKLSGANSIYRLSSHSDDSISEMVVTAIGKNITSIVIHYKNGSFLQAKVLSTTLSPQFTGREFVYDKGAYKGVEIIDFTKR